MKNLQVSKKTIIFVASLVVVIAILFGCVATKVGLKCDDDGCEFVADSIEFNNVFQFSK